MSKKPFVVCLLNGMGIEDAKSYNIYSSEVMPTLDQFTNRYLFSTLNSSGKGVGLSENASATRELGYLNIGAGTIVKQSIQIVNEKIENNIFFENEALQYVIDHVRKNNSTIHLITLIGHKYGEDSMVHLRKMVEYCDKIGIKNICLHLYLGANNNSLDKSFPKYTSMVHRILNLYPNVKLSIISGIKHLKDSSGIVVTKELYKVTVGGIGEHWINYNEAVDSNYKRKNLEENIVPFIVHDNALIKNTDGVFIFNYENDLGSVYTDLLVQPSKYMYTNNTGINIMSKDTKIDPRIKRTKRFLIDALTELLKEKDINSITVQDLTKKADLTRGTFYLHYADMDEFLYNSMYDILNELVELVKPKHITKKITNINELNSSISFLNLFEYIGKNSEYFKLMLSEKGYSKFRSHLENLIKDKIYDNLVTSIIENENQLSVEQNILISYIISAHIGVIYNWLEKGMKYSPQYMASQLTQLTFEGVLNAAGLKLK